MPDYQLGKIYKIVCNITNEVYIGSTTQTTLAQRLAKHSFSYKDWLKNPVKYRYVSSYQIIARGNYEIILLESCPCNNKDELRMKEREWFDKIKNINMVKPFRSIEEVKEQKKQWNEDHKEEVKEQQKKWYEKNKEEVKEQKKQWYEEHKEEIREKSKELFTCDCGSIFKIIKKLRHFKSQKHQNYLSNLNVDGLELK